MSNIEFESFSLKSEQIEIKGLPVQVISFTGKILNGNAYQISRNIPTIFENENYNIILDLSQLDYINSVGVAMLLTIIKSVDQHSGKMVIGGLNRFLENVIRLMELPKKVQIFHTLEEAKSNW